MTTKDKRPIITRPGFSLLPSALLAACKTRKGTVFVYANLWDHASGDPANRGNAFPSVETQSRECGMDPKDVREARRWLECHGWLDRTERPGLTPMFKVRLEQRERPPRGRTPGGNAPRVKNPKGPLGQTPHPTPGGNAPPINNPLTRTNPTALEPPLPPAAQGALRPEAVAARADRDPDGFLAPDPDPQPAAQVLIEVQPQPQQPNPPRPLPEPPDPEAIAPVQPKAQRRQAGFTPTVEDVPAALLAVQRELLAFWPARNCRAKRTNQAWRLMLTEARKIQEHHQGGTEILRSQLAEGIQAKVCSNGWQGLNFSRWERYGAKAGTPIMGSGLKRRLTQDDHAAEALAFIRARDARRQQEQQQEPSRLVLAEVA